MLRNLCRVLTCVSVVIFRTVNVFLYYSLTLDTSKGSRTSTSIVLSTLASAFVEVAAFFIAAGTVNRIGRSRSTAGAALLGGTIALLKFGSQGK